MDRLDTTPAANRDSENSQQSNNITRNAGEIKHFCAAGLHIVAIPHLNGKPTKAPVNKGWNLPKTANNPGGYSANADDFINCDGFNFGLAHVPSRTMALDLDALDKCLTLFDDVGVPLQDWLNDFNRVEIQSGKPNRGKLLFRLPDGVQSFITRQYKHKDFMLFELRNATKTGTTVQDVIWGSHPDTGTTYKVIGDIANMPEIPAELLNVALHWEAWKPCFDSALGIEAVPPKIAPRKPQQGENLPGRRDPIQEFNQSCGVQDVLIRNGYKPTGKDRFIRPGSTSKEPAAVIMRNCADGIEKIYSHGGDSLNDGWAHDAFDCFCLLECRGDFNNALNWSPEITKHNKTIWAKEQAAKGERSSQENTTSGSDADSANYEPEPLRAPVPKAEAYPVKALGYVLGEAALALHETIKAPLTLCCQGVIASASLAAQSHYDVMMPWGEKKPTSLYLLTVAESGERKTGVDEVVLGAAKAQERLEMDAFNIAKEKYDADIAAWKTETQPSKSQKSRKSQRDADLNAAAQHEAQNKPIAPIMPLRFVSDPTVEGLYKLFQQGQPSLGLFSDEAGLLIGGHALNSDNALKTMARLCKVWDGSAFDRVRGGDGSGVLYGRRLALHQAAQPAVMMQLLGDRMANGQGFLARCLAAWPESTIGSRYIDSFQQPGGRKEIKRLFAKLKVLTEAVPSTGKNNQELEPMALSLSDGAIEILIAASNQFEDLMKTGNDLAELRDRTSKAIENACRIAGVMTVVEEGLAARVIDTSRLSRALIIVQWYLAEALRIRGSAIVPQAVSDAESLSIWLDERGFRMFRSKQVLNKGPSHLRNKTRLQAAIKELVDNGYIEPNEPGIIIDGVITKQSWSVRYVV